MLGSFVTHKENIPVIFFLVLQPISAPSDAFDYM